MTDRAVKAETSSANSGLTRHNYRVDENISSSGFQTAESMSIEWTNEKHSSYLNLMEASFVKQLYSDEYTSLDLFGFRSRKKPLKDTSSSRHLNADTRNSSGQFKVLQSGCWKKIDFERAPQHVDYLDNSNVLENPWIQHFIPMEKQQEVTAPSLEKNGGLCHEGVPLRWKPSGSNRISSLEPGFNDDPIFSCEEMSGQNFVNEENEEEKQVVHLHRTKRMKTISTNVSTKDQVVPMDYNESNAYLEKEPAGANSQALKERETVLRLEPKGASCS